MIVQRFKSLNYFFNVVVLIQSSHQEVIFEYLTVLWQSLMEEGKSISNGD